MKHKPSEYTGSITLNYQQLWETRKALCARMSEWIADGRFDEKQAELTLLMEVGELLDQHIDKAVEEWEDLVVKNETVDLDKSIEELLEDGYEDEE